MKENFFSAAMYGSLSPEDTISQMREAMKAGFGGDSPPTPNHFTVKCPGLAKWKEGADCHLFSC